MKRLTGLCSLLFLFILLLCACGAESTSVPEKKAAAASTAAVAERDAAVESASPEAESEPAAEPPAEGYTARLMEYNSAAYNDVILNEGDAGNTRFLPGYTFDGFTDADGRLFIDETGTVVQTYHGSEQLILTPQFSPKKFEVIFFENGTPLTMLGNRSFLYDSEILQGLPIGEVIKKTSRNDSEADRVIIGFEDSDGNRLVDYTKTGARIPDFENSIDYSTNTVALNVVTTQIGWIDTVSDRSSTIDNDGFFKQDLTGKDQTFLCFDLSPDVDLTALKALGYETAIIDLDLVLTPKGGTPHVKLYSAAQDPKKVNKSELLFDSEKCGDKKPNRLQDYEPGQEKNYDPANVSVPIDQLSDKLYAYFNTEGVAIVGNIVKDQWVLSCTTLKVTFE